MTRMATRSEHPTAEIPRHKVLGYVTLTLRIFQSESVDCSYASECVELSVGSCGKTIDEALSNIIEATEQYLNAIQESGEVARVFRKKGIPTYLGEPREEARNVVTHPNELVQILLYRMLVDVPDGVLTPSTHVQTASV
jgi:hypothetical protein